MRAWILILLALAGCQSSEERARIAAEEDHATCVSYGLEFGDPEYPNCRLLLRQERQMKRANAIAAYGYIMNQQQMQTQRTQSFTCQQIGQTVYCN